jgi:fermentation-respiration switch protein FrsA (DUF1100 family)
MLSLEMLVVDGLAVALLYIGLSPRVATPIYRTMLFHPARYPEGNYDVETIDGIQPQDVFFESADGTRLHGWYFKNKSAGKTIVFHHGNAANLSTRLGLIQLQLRAGASVFIYDYRGFGRSEGLPDVQGICDDGTAAFDYLVNQEGLPADSIINYGESLGTGVAGQVSTVRPGAGLILQSGFTSLRKIGSEVVPWIRIFPNTLFPQPDLDNLAIVTRAHPPLMIMHGMKDNVVPFEHGKLLADRATEPKRFIQFTEAGHNDISFMNPDRYEAGIREFLASLDVPARC